MIQDLVSGVQSPALPRDINQITFDQPSNPLEPQESPTRPPIAKTGDNDLVGIMFQLIYLKSKSPYLLFVI